MTITNTATQSQPALKARPKPDRRVGIVSAMSEGERGEGLITLRVGNEPTGHYRVEKVPSDFGRAFRVVKLLIVEGEDGMPAVQEGEGYHVHLDVIGTAHSCECKGWLHWQNCKHVGGLLALLERGKA